MKPKAIFFWSGGKDSALALHTVLQENEIEIVALLTTINNNYKRISMHGVREVLLDLQAELVGIPLIKMYVEESTNAEYEKKMEEILFNFKGQGITHVVFGDIFLEDLREYRENNLSKIGLKALFPLWKKDTLQLTKHFFDLGFKTITCCINDAYLTKEHTGVELSPDFISSLPKEVDPCGENGEYHTFCFAGPLFKKEIKFKVAEKTYRPLEVKLLDDGVKPQTKGFWFCELLPVPNKS